MSDSPWLTRRSIREYTNQVVSSETITDLLHAAMAAPSAGNQQPWHFVVIRDRDLLSGIADCHQHAGMLRRASAAILVCGEPAIEKQEGFWVQDCSAATENILIATEAAGLGGVWVGVYPVQDRMIGIRNLLGMPESVLPFSVVALGYPGESKPPACRYDSSRIHADRWGQPWE